MFTNFLVSKVTKIENSNKMELYLDQTFGSYCISEVKEIMIFQLKQVIFAKPVVVRT